MAERGNLPLTVRPFEEKDRNRIEEICLDAGGRGGSYRDWLDVSPDFFCDLWINYYLDNEPDLAFVATVGDEVVGYLIASRSAKKKDEVMSKVYYSRMFKRWLSGKYKTGFGVLLTLGRVARDWICFGMPEFNQEKYPGDIHINVAKGQRRFHEIVFFLLCEYFAAAKEKGIKGVHGLMTFERRKLKSPGYLGWKDIDIRPTSIFPGRELYLVTIGHVVDELDKNLDPQPEYTDTYRPVKVRKWYKFYLKMTRRNWLPEGSL